MDPIETVAGARAEHRFPTTRWQDLLRSSPGSTRRALEAFARDYSAPIAEWFRASLSVPADRAADLAQSFFVKAIETDFLERADPERGRFRPFLKSALANFARDERRAAAAAKRGGGRGPAPLDAAADAIDPRDGAAGDDALDAAWRRALVERALAEVERELAATGRARQFAVFRDWFLSDDPALDHASVAARHGATTADVSNWLARVKRAYRERLLALLRDTVAGEEEFAAERAWFFGKEPA